MVIPGVLLLVIAALYWFYTKDTPAGNFDELPERKAKKKAGSLADAAKDYRTWILFLAYGACFGIEVTFDNVAALYFAEKYGASLTMAGLLAGAFGFMNIFARAMGGIVADKVGNRFGMAGKGIAAGRSAGTGRPGHCILWPHRQHHVGYNRHGDLCDVPENGQWYYLRHGTFHQP